MKCRAKGRPFSFHVKTILEVSYFSSAFTDVQNPKKKVKA